jgi:hypothetical protein
VHALPLRVGSPVHFYLPVALCVRTWTGRISGTFGAYASFARNLIHFGHETKPERTDISTTFTFRTISRRFAIPTEGSISTFGFRVRVPEDRVVGFIRIPSGFGRPRSRRSNRGRNSTKSTCADGSRSHRSLRPTQARPSGGPSVAHQVRTQRRVWRGAPSEGVAKPSTSVDFLREAPLRNQLSRKGFGADRRTLSASPRD